VFCRALLRLRRAALRVPPAARVLLPAAGGAAIGGVIIAVPEVMGVGYEYIDQALNNGLALRTLLLLCGVKIVATLISYASGNAGGIFAPSLFIGAMAGGALGIVAGQAAPFPTADPGAYALVGMGALFAGIIRAPMTSVFMIFEITQDYQILVPLMVANLLSFVISRRYQPVPIYHALLEQDGITLPATPPTVPTDGWTAGDVMRPEPLVLPGDEPVANAAARMRGRGETAYLVGAGDPVVVEGVVAAADLWTALSEQRGPLPVRALATPAPDPLPVDATREIVLDRLAGAARLVPVVTRQTDGGRRLCGTIGPDDVLRYLAARAAIRRT
jgi:CIC family chloride channel protein